MMGRENWADSGMTIVRTEQTMGTGIVGTGPTVRTGIPVIGNRNITPCSGMVEAGNRH